jgi:hypothetical protein
MTRYSEIFFASVNPKGGSGLAASPQNEAFCQSYWNNLNPIEPQSKMGYGNHSVTQMTKGIYTYER